MSFQSDIIHAGYSRLFKRIANICRILALVVCENAYNVYFQTAHRIHFEYGKLRIHTDKHLTIRNSSIINAKIFNLIVGCIN